MRHFVRRFVALLIVALMAFNAAAQSPVSLLSADAKNYGFNFNHGAEFPGAVGSLTVDDSTKYGDRPTMKLHGDFTGGGAYVQAGKKLADVDVRDLILTVRNPGADRFTIRLGDKSGQTHQIVVKTDATDDWQTITLPLENFFANRGKADAVASIAKYESWGGAKDGNWHGPATGLYLLLGKTDATKVRTLWIGAADVVLRPTAVAGAEQAVFVPLSETADGTHEWKFTNGPEFKGATGSLTVVDDEPTAGATSLKLSGDFTGGGAYVAMNRHMPELNANDVAAFRMKLKGNAASVSIQLVDSAGQTHQRKGVKLNNDGAWHDFAIVPQEIAGGEHWGGPNDGKWRGPPRIVQIALTKGSEPKSSKPELLVAEVRAEAIVPVFRSAAAATFNFDAASYELGEWTIAGDVKLDHASGSRAIKLARTLDDVERPCSATSPRFAMSPGRWEIGAATKCDLRSPDSSYNGVLALECLDANGGVVERFTIAEQFGRVDRQAAAKIVETPPTTVAGRFVSQLNKTYGVFWIDDLTATKLAPAPWQDDRITRMTFDTSELGNLLYPDSSRKITVHVEAKKPLADAQKSLSYEVRDYWGARQAEPATVSLVRSTDEKGDGFVYTAEFDLADVPLAVGRYYEIHASVPLGNAEPFRNFTSLAILPEAENKKHKPDEVPFTARNWDNRIREYIHLTDRLGVRICGLWGAWSSTPPYKPEAPGLELCRELGMGWLTTTPIKLIERGNTEYDETALRQGVRNFLEKYGHERPLVINLGNEPHGTGEKVLRNVAAYKIVYDEIKKIDSTIPVVATSVEPNEEYFAAGYGQACDAFDFHIYEDLSKVRRTIGEYRALQKKYDCVKPIWSTELGLNSQGQTRHVVAVELVKKFSTFFAAGGENVSWFGLLYPDPDGKSYGSSGDSHNVFDCRYKRYAPRLDAVMYYHMVNAVGIKKFVEEKTYGDDIHAFLFRDRDGKCLQVLWKDQGREDISVARNARAVRVVRIDGSEANYLAKGFGATISVTPDPLLLTYESQDGLPDAPSVPFAWLKKPPTEARRGESIELTLIASTSGDDVDLQAPPSWTVSRAPDVERKVVLTIEPPIGDKSREAEFVVNLGPYGELYHRVKIVE